MNFKWEDWNVRDWIVATNAPGITGMIINDFERISSNDDLYKFIKSPILDIKQQTDLFYKTYLISIDACVDKTLIEKISIIFDLYIKSIKKVNAYEGDVNEIEIPILTTELDGLSNLKLFLDSF